MAEVQVKFTVEGIQPLLTHNPASMLDKKEGKAGRRIPSPEEEAEAACYRLPDGTLGLPSIAFRAAIVSAAGAFKATRGRGSLKNVVSHIRIEPEVVSLINEDGKSLKEYQIDIRRAVLQRAAVLRARPRLDNWRASFSVVCDPDLFGTDPRTLLIPILEDAGNRIGVGDYRPQKGGWFGRFRIVE